MSRRQGDVFHIEPELDAECELCGMIAELRPYGENDERICYACAIKDPLTTERKMRAAMEGVSHVTAPADAVARARRARI